MTFLLTIGFVVLLVMHLSLRERVSMLEKSKEQQSPEVVSQAPTAQPQRMEATATTPEEGNDSFISYIPPKEAQPKPVQFAPPIQSATVPQKPSEPSAIELWFKENTLIKVGAIIFFLGAVWFVSYAISQGWISPLARILLGIGVGVIVVIVGRSRRLTSVEQYVTLTSLGASIIIASVYAGQNLFSLFNPLVALVLLLITIGYAVLVSLLTSKQWLCVTAVIAALVAPLMVNAPEANATTFFLYLMMISIGFLGVLSQQSWRGVPFTLALGVSLYEFLYYTVGEINDKVLWLFVILFSAIFYTAVTTSMLRDREPKSIDMTTLGIVAVSFVIWADRVAFFDGLSTFIAAFVVATTGYVLHHRALPQKLIAIYVSLAGLLALVATSMTFTGFTMTLAYAVEIGAAIAFASDVRFPDRIINTVSLLFAIPLTLSILATGSSDWNHGVAHEAGYSLYAVLCTSFALSLWLLHLGKQKVDGQLIRLSGAFIFITYTLWLITTTIFWNSLYPESTVESVTTVLTYLSWILVTLLLSISQPLLKMPIRWMPFILASVLLPLALSLESFLSSTWSNGALHVDAMGVYIVVGTMAALLGWFSILRNQNRENPEYLIGAVTYLTLFWGTAVILCWQFWHAILPGGEVSIVASYVSWASLSYILTYYVYQIRLPKEWFILTVSSFVLPVMVSISSFDSPLWDGSWLHPAAAGLYVMTTLALVMGITFAREARAISGEHSILLQKISKTFLVSSGLYATALVWMISHANLNDSAAVTVSLFIYTLTGLGFYLLSKRTGRKDFKLVSIILLSGVVARLALVDVWDMEVIWRIVTFLGIGLLFIITALVEKPFKPSNDITTLRE